MMRNPVRMVLPFMSLAAMLGGPMGWSGPVMPEPKPLKKCALPGCDNETNRSYCCAEHCRQHREQLKTRR